ncbi:hypothetical protein GALL_153450 [mine drainage metagenome]|uniref:Uncharacterized protein n=1 Tax=mine drainage metagenome TaxID=410659 RepID=A0A1J5S2Z9_9ZZZZ
MKLLEKLAGIVTGNPMTLVWVFLAGLAVGAIPAGMLAWTVQGWRLEAVKAEFSGFVATTKAQGEAAKKVAAIQHAADVQRMEEANRENSNALATLAGTIKRLRDANDRAQRSVVPAAPPASSRPDLACFDRAELKRALGSFLAGVAEETRGLLDEGSTCTVNLNTVKRWAQDPESHLKMATGLP